VNDVPHSLRECQLLGIKVITNGQDSTIPDHKNAKSKTGGY
jgi:hypothetical protein